MSKYKEALAYFMGIESVEGVTYEEVRETDGTITAKHFMRLKELIDTADKYRQTEKALDKACNRISAILGVGTVDYWKKRFLKDAED